MFVLVALASSFCFAGAVVLQQRVAQTHGATLGLLRRPAWLGGITVDLAGFLLQVVALHSGGVVGVQAIETTSLPFGMVLSRQRPHRQGWVGAAMLVVGLGALIIALHPRAGTPHDGRLLTAGIVIAVVASLTPLIGGRVPQALGAGLLFSLVAAIATIVGDQVATQHIWTPLAHPEVYLMALASVLGLTLEQRAFAAGSLAPTLVTLTLVDPLSSLALGVVATGDRLRGGFPAVIAGVAGVVAAVGVVLLARERGIAPVPAAEPAGSS